jgi:hypothetical protein
LRSSCRQEQVSDFAALRAAIEREPHRLVLFALDLLLRNGAGLRRLPLIGRREKLGQLIPVNSRSRIQFNDQYEGERADLFRQACASWVWRERVEAGAQPLQERAIQILAEDQECGGSELILLGTDYASECKPIAYLGRELESGLQFAGTAFLTFGGKARE